MDVNKSNPKAEAEEAETAKMDPSDLELGSNCERLDSSSKEEDESETEKSSSDESETEKESLSEAAKKMVPSHLSTFIDELLGKCDDDCVDLDWLISGLVDYYGIALSQVSFQSVVNMLQEYPLSKLIHVPLSLIPTPVYELSIDFMKMFALDTLTDFVRSASHLILTECRPGVVRPNAEKSEVVATFVVLAMALRTKPHVLTLVLPELREKLTYQGYDKLPVLIWMIAQAFQTHWNSDSLFPLLKEVSLAPDSIASANALEQIFTFSLELAGGQGNPPLANEATAIAISVLTQNVDCFKQWDVLYEEHLEASVALLKNLVDEWKDHSLKLITVKNAMNSFRMKNEKAITEGVANLSLYKEADKSCKLIYRRLCRGPETAPFTEKGEETEKEAAILPLSEAAKKIDPSPLGTFLDDLLKERFLSEHQKILKLIDYYGVELSQVSFQWVVNMFKEYPLSNLIDVPLSLLPMPVYKKSLDFINTLPFRTLPGVVLFASDLILTEWPGVVKVVHPNADISKVATFVVLAMVLRTKPDAFTLVLPKLRETPAYQGHDKLPVLIWMIAQASQGDLCAGLYSWVRNLLPLVVNNEECYNSQSVDLILQFVEMILSSNPEARAVLLNKAVSHGERLIPPCSFEMLVRLTFPAPSARVEATERFEAIYPLLKEVALAPDSITSANALEQIFTFSLELAGKQGNPALANEATAIAISVLTQNVDCFKQWDVLYEEHLEASVALLKNLVDEWKDHSLKLITVKNAMNSFRMKNEKAITEGVANLSLFKEADQSCKLFSRRLSRGPGITPLTAMVIAAAAAAAGGVVGAALALSNRASGKNVLSVMK